MFVLKISFLLMETGGKCLSGHVTSPHKVTSGHHVVCSNMIIIRLQGACDPSDLRPGEEDLLTADQGEE